MKYVSDTYKNSMKQVFRNGSQLRIGVYEVNSTLENFSSIMFSHDNENANVDNMVYPFDVGVDGYFTGEMNDWVIGDTIRIAETQSNNPYAKGFLSDIMADDQAEILFNDVNVYFTFNEPTDFKGITLEQDSKRDEQYFNFDYDLLITDSHGHTTTLRNIHTNNYRCETIPDVTRVEIAFRENNIAPYNKIRLDKVMFGKMYVFTNEEIASATWHDESDPLCRRLPKQTLKFEVIDYEGRFDPMKADSEYQYVDTDEIVTMEYGYDIGGTIEWLPCEFYFIDSKPTYGTHTATFSCNKMNSKFNNVVYANPVGGTGGKVGEKIKDLCRYAKINLDIDDYYANQTISRSQLLHGKVSDTILMLANACGCGMYFDRNGTVVVEPLLTDVPDLTLDGDSVYYETEKFIVNPKVRKLLWTKHSFNATNEDYEQGVELALGINVIDFYDKVTGVTLVNFTGTILEKCTDGMIVNVTNIGNNPKIVGKRVNDVTTDSEIVINSSGEDVSIDNFWISRDNTATPTVWRNYISKRNVIEFNYRGNPEIEMGDNVYYVDKYGNVRFCRVLSNEITFNGGIHGRMILKDEGYGNVL